MLLSEEIARSITGALAAETVPEVADLGQWALNEQIYDATQAARAGFLFGGADIQGTEQLFVSEFSRSQWVNGADGKRRRYGTAVRLYVKASSVSAQAKIGLSFLAAEAQMRNVSAQSEITVVGYVGDIGAHFLTQGTFDVEDYVKMRLNMNGLIETITGNPENIRPTLLEESSADIQEEQDDFQRIVGKLWALSRIADKKSCSKAKQDFPEGARGLIAVSIEDTYRTLSAPFGGVPRPCDNKSLGTGAQEFAKARLLGLKLSKD